MTITRKDVVKLYVAYSLCMDSDVFIQLFGGLTANGAQIAGFQSANPVLLIFSLVLVSWTLLLLIPIHKRMLTVLLNVTFLSALYLWSCLSCFWAVQPALVIRLGVPLCAYFVCGAIASHYLTTDEVATLIGRLTSVIAVLSLVWERFGPAHAAIAPGWAGIYGEKNHLGMGMGVGILALLVSSRPWNLSRIVQITLCFVLLIGSQSATAIGFVAITVCTFALLRVKARLRPLAISLVTGAIILPAAFVPNSIDKAFGAAGKDTNFTGRDVIWRYVYQQWSTRPMLGFGYSNFWITEDAGVTQNLGWNPGSAHNGFLETLLNTGIVGEVLLLCALGGGLRLAVRAWHRGHRVAATWLLLAWIAMVIDDLTEADFMVPAPLWFTYCLVFFLTYAELRRVTVRGAQNNAAALRPGFPTAQAAFAFGAVQSGSGVRLPQVSS